GPQRQACRRACSYDVDVEGLRPAEGGGALDVHERVVGGFPCDEGGLRQLRLRHEERCVGGLRHAVDLVEELAAIRRPDVTCCPRQTASPLLQSLIFCCLQRRLRG